MLLHGAISMSPNGPTPLQSHPRPPQEFGAFLAKMVPMYGDDLLQKGAVARDKDVNEFMMKKASW